MGTGPAPGPERQGSVAAILAAQLVAGRRPTIYGDGE